MRRSCEGCRYWSELIAESIGGGPVKALCLHPKRKQSMTYRGCEQYEAGRPVDLDIAERDADNPAWDIDDDAPF